MVWIEATAGHQSVIHGTRDEIIALVRNVPVSGPMFPGVAGIDDLGESRYRWRLKERRTLGTSFSGSYVAEYTDSDDGVSWKTVEGNMTTRGRWRVSGRDGQVLVHVEATTELDAPVPRVLKTPAQLFAVKETRDGLKTQVKGVKAFIEAAAARP
ncbi:MAG: hypothetical protein AAF449_17960 [Myxococcota bacterium]